MVIGSNQRISQEVENQTVGCEQGGLASEPNLKKSLVRVFSKKTIAMISVVGLLGLIAASAWYWLGLEYFLWVLIISLVGYFVYKNWRWFYVAICTAPRDIRALLSYIQLIIQVKTWQRRNASLSAIFRENVKKHPDKACILFEDKVWTFSQLEEFSNKVASAFSTQGFKKGDIVALLMENRPEFVGLWLGLTKIGAVVPLINTNQRLGSLLHSLNIVKSQAVIFSGHLSDAIVEITDSLSSNLSLFQYDCKNLVPNAKNLDALIQQASSNPAEPPELNHHEHLVYIYTSGTTGLPKAAVISNSRFLFITAAIHCLSGFKSSDCFYTPLPLYHTAGGCMSIGQMLVYGATVVIKQKFSASSYFPDCKKYNCTIAQYIGEMCRYILAVPPSSSDTGHSLRQIYGNGLRPQIWKEFAERFHIPKISEFYGATEGNANIVNIDNTIGAIGFVSRIIPSVYPISIIKCNPFTGEPLRNSAGFCVPCKPNEPGVFIGKITPNNPSRAFLGYVNKEASEKKVIRDVFSKGDMAFLSGDIITADEFGYLYFKDRTGDTFRWKGENVSTSEVEAVLSNILTYKDVVVYGVEIPGQEGRAGMAAVYDPTNQVDLEFLAREVRKSLPFYAKPIFVRILNHLDMTGTYKLKKNDLQNEGINVNVIKDSIYYLDSKGTYVMLTTEAYDQINKGLIRL